MALDPELLGSAFENLLAEYNPETREAIRKRADRAEAARARTAHQSTRRRQTGSYYTPRPVVDYMVDEALIESLAESTTPTDGDPVYWRERLRYLLDHHDAAEFFEDDETNRLVRAIAQLKVLDPAVGSGAFPDGRPAEADSGAAPARLRQSVAGKRCRKTWPWNASRTRFRSAESAGTRRGATRKSATPSSAIGTPTSAASCT